jgi:diacylglycerol kinase (ATP)
MLRALRRHHISFKNAIAGIIWAITTQPNFRVHITLAVLAVASGLYFRITRLEMLVIVFTIILGMTGEMINTAIESMTDLITREYRQEAKIAKDVSAGMMLTIAIGAVAVASYIFVPYILLHFGVK